MRILTVIIRGTGAIIFDNFAFKPDLDSIERMDSSKLFQNLLVLGKKELLNVSVLQLCKLESSLLRKLYLVRSRT